MSDQNPDDTGVWSPPAAEPSWFTPSKRLPRPDARVWPPPEPEPRGSSTVPIPVIQDGPAPRRQPWPPPAPSPAAVPAPFEAPYPGPSPSAPVAQASPPAQPSRRRRRPMPKAVKIGVQLAGAVGLTAAFLAIRGYDALNRFEKSVPPARVQQVSPGQEVPLADAKWRLLGIAVVPDQRPDLPDRTMIQIDVQATALNAEGTRYSYSLPGFYMADKAGRTWTAEPRKVPDELSPGVPGRFTLLSAVPKELVDQVELMLWPSLYAGEREAGPALRFGR
ncbi:hypothetical protein AB0O34_11335 [Sphaerisporangium sp. NPDC088356]|uniref:hypothetical protein n=1 Tax=Sphaerisporangium sp. NPDC088356 TaxID=3154871 RepID=UPI00343ABDFA